MRDGRPPDAVNPLVGGSVCRRLSLLDLYESTCVRATAAVRPMLIRQMKYHIQIWIAAEDCGAIGCPAVYIIMLEVENHSQKPLIHL